MSLFYFIGLLSLIKCCLTQLIETESNDPAEVLKYMNEANNLYYELFTKRSYNRFLSPIYIWKSDNSTSSKVSKLNVHFDLWYVKLISLDAESQLLSICLELKTYWQDVRLSWNESEFGGLESIFVSSDAIWIPDSQIGNAKTLDSVKGDETMRAAQLFSNGSIFFPFFYYTEVACPIIINTFPFDKQICPIPIMSMSFDVNSIAVSASVNPFVSQFVDIKNVEAMAKSVSMDSGQDFMITKAFVQWGNGEWDVTNITTFRTVQAGMEVTMYLLSIQRVPNFYVYVIALPCFILTALSIVGMFWTPNIKKEQLVKLTIGLTSLVSMTVLLEMLADSIPKTNVFPLLGIYVVCCVGITSAASVVITLHCLPNPKKYHGQEEEEIKKSPTKKCKMSEPMRSPLQLVLGIFHRNIFLLLFFQALNFAGFIVFLSYWN